MQLQLTEAITLLSKIQYPQITNEEVYDIIESFQSFSNDWNQLWLSIRSIIKSYPLNQVQFFIFIYQPLIYYDKNQPVEYSIKHLFFIHCLFDHWCNGSTKTNFIQVKYIFENSNIKQCIQLVVSEIMMSTDIETDGWKLMVIQFIEHSISPEYFIPEHIWISNWNTYSKYFTKMNQITRLDTEYIERKFNMIIRKKQGRSYD